MLTRAAEIYREEGGRELATRGGAFVHRRACAWLSRRGEDQYCPVCQQTCWRFLPAGIGGRPGADCPHCGVRERHRLFWLHLQTAEKMRAGGRLLYIAPMRGLADALNERTEAEIVTADIDPEHADTAADVTTLPFGDGCFDAILCSHVLEHVPDDGAAMAELRRVLAPDGWAILQVPIDRSREQTFEDPSVTTPAEREEVFGQWDHVRICGPDYFDRIQEAGFVVEQIGHASRVGDATMHQMGLPEEPICRCVPA